MLARTYRLSSSDDFDRVIKQGRKVVCSSFVLFGLPHKDVKASRLGLVVSRKVGSAVMRNRVKRILRESFRHDLVNAIAKEYSTRDFVVIVRPRAARLHTHQIRSDFLSCLERLQRSLKDTAFSNIQDE